MVGTVSKAVPASLLLEGNASLPNAWFRMYAEFADDPKVQMMSEAFQRRLTMLFCSRCKEENLSDEQRAFKWRISLEELAETKHQFTSNHIIDDHWNIINWNRRQFLSDSSTERVRKHRQALKQDETLHETVVPVTVTAPDTDTDTEQKHKKTSSNGKRLTLEIAQQEEKIYDAYPRKVGKALALKAIRNAVTRLVAGSFTEKPMADSDEARRFLWKKTAQYASSPAGSKLEGEDYRPHPASWFNQERYFDDLAEWQKSRNGAHANGKSVLTFSTDLAASLDAAAHSQPDRR